MSVCVCGACVPAVRCASYAEPVIHDEQAAEKARADVEKARADAEAAAKVRASNWLTN